MIKINGLHGAVIVEPGHIGYVYKGAEYHVGEDAECEYERGQRDDQHGMLTLRFRGEVHQVRILPGDIARVLETYRGTVRHLSDSDEAGASDAE